ncbi:hypothetical protein BRCON_2607 [Candidatus Sumerlaea chitinivorans]|uniref:Uncharacterized protein n=1 Tax=Sumerlaea chitinivorans TaxID=2250252 RepID=A0A2Z4Y906_SUMC1|nr:hypothetical protein BRCON_2607 [Candidatus Sumerlaea chitinivorans]
MNIGDKQTLIKSLWSNNIELFLQRPRTKGQLTFLLWQTNRDRYLNGPRVAGRIAELISPLIQVVR